VAALRARGRLVLFSALPRRAAVDWQRVHSQELEILGACNDEDLIDEAAEFLHGHSEELSSLITHELPFHRWHDALALAREGHACALKVALTFPKP
jgi:threonine dehydrogenase-like Zn-dependent dehydrogenase